MQHAGHTVTVGGIDYPCIPASMRDTELRNHNQTFRENYQASIALVNSDVTVEIDDTVTYKGTIRRVLETGLTGDGLQNVLHLGKRFGG